MKQYPMIDKKRTAGRIRFFMRYQGLKPADIQAYLGLTCVQTVYRWLDGTNIPSVDNIYALSRLFGVRVDDLLAGNEKIVPLSSYCKSHFRIMMYYENLEKLEKLV